MQKQHWRFKAGTKMKLLQIQKFKLNNKDSISSQRIPAAI
jgi:hypothetical protein